MYPKIKSISHRFALWPQWLAATEVFLIAIIVGLTSGWVSPYLAKLSKPDSEIQITKEDASWIASLINIAKLVGAILESNYVLYIGSKSSTLISGFFFALGWICFFIDNSVISIYAYRILSGIATGMLYNAFPLYIGEIADPKIRGALVSFILQGVMVGNLIGSIMGAHLDTWMFAAISLAPNLLFMFSFYFVPHSPHYLVRQNKFDEAAKSIKWYNRNSDVQSELSVLKTLIQTDSSSSYCDTLRNINTPLNRKIFLMLNIIYCFIPLSGIYAVTAYMEIILTQAQVTVTAPSNIVIVVNITSILTSWISMYTNDKCGRTIMLIVSSATVGLSLIMLAVNYQLLELGFDSPHLQWLSIMGVIILRSALPIGLMTVPPILMGELFAPSIKSFGSCVTNINAAILTFAVIKSYQPMVDLLSEKWVFYIYVLPLVVVGFYTVFFIPETKKKSLAEIQEMLTKEKSIESNVI